MPKYPDICVKLTGQDGNAFAIIGRVRQELRRANVEKDDIDLFLKEAMSGSYDHLLQTCTKWVDVR